MGLRSPAVVAATLLLLVNLHAAAGFITAKNNRFVDDSCGQDFVFAGWNTWRLVEAGANIPGAVPRDISSLNGQDYVPWLFAQAKKQGLTFVRFFGAADLDGGWQGSPLQIAPGRYNEDVFRGFDNVLFNAAKYNIKASIVLTDFWKKTDGVQQYLAWCAENTTEVSQFYINERCKQMFFDHVTVVANRRNTLNGIAYKDDPTILGWEIINEPRCRLNDSGVIAAPSSCVEGMQTFINEAAAHIKSVDRNHLVTVGEEGFFGTNGLYAQFNANATRSSGQAFEVNHASPNIDYTSIHIWPDNWDARILPPSFVTTWIEQHQTASAALNKPMVISEFGIKCRNANASCVQSTRNPYFENVYQSVQSSLTSGGRLRGSAFWYLTAQAPGDSNPRFEYSIGFEDSTFMGPIQQAADFATSRSNACPVPTNASDSAQTAG